MAPEQRGSADRKKANGMVRSAPRVVGEMGWALPQPSAIKELKEGTEQKRNTDGVVADGKAVVGKRKSAAGMTGMRRGEKNESKVGWALPQPSPMEKMKKDVEQGETGGVVADEKAAVRKRKSTAGMTGMRQSKKDESGQVSEGVMARGPRGLDPPTMFTALRVCKLCQKEEEDSSLRKKKRRNEKKKKKRDRDPTSALFQRHAQLRDVLARGIARGVRLNLYDSFAKCNGEDTRAWAYCARTPRG